MDNAPDTYAQLIAFLDRGGAEYRLIDHEPEGRTEVVSPMRGNPADAGYDRDESVPRSSRGNPLKAAAKCIVLMVKLGKKTTRYVLAVVPGDPADAGYNRDESAPRLSRHRRAAGGQRRRDDPAVLVQPRP